MILSFGLAKNTVWLRTFFFICFLLSFFWFFSSFYPISSRALFHLFSLILFFDFFFHRSLSCFMILFRSCQEHNLTPYGFSFIFFLPSEFFRKLSFTPVLSRNQAKKHAKEGRNQFIFIHFFFLSDHIIVYRDGVGDSQLEAVRATEVAQAKEACRESNLIFSVVQKRISTRFIVQSKRKKKEEKRKIQKKRRKKGREKNPEINFWLFFAFLFISFSGAFFFHSFFLFPFTLFLFPFTCNTLLLFLFIDFFSL